MNEHFDPLDPDTYHIDLDFTDDNMTTIAVSDYDFTNTTISPSDLQVQGDAEFKGNITWQGRDMREWLESVESRLAILRPNTELEAEWSELAELRMKYVELERKLLEKQQVFDILKKS
jgi:hypothetical protein